MYHAGRTVSRTQPALLKNPPHIRSGMLGCLSCNCRSLIVLVKKDAVSLGLGQVPAVVSGPNGLLSTSGFPVVVSEDKGPPFSALAQERASVSDAHTFFSGNFDYGTAVVLLPLVLSAGYRLDSGPTRCLRAEHNTESNRQTGPRKRPEVFSHRAYNCRINH